MPEINNGLAAQIQVPQVDVLGTLGKAAQLRQLEAESGLKEQELKYRQGVLDRNNNYYTHDVVELGQAKNIQAETAGRIGNAYLANPTDGTWHAAVEEAKKAGLIRNSLEEAQYRNMPKEQRSGVAKALQQYGQSSTQNIEQNPAAIAPRAQAHSGGAELGTMYGPPGREPAPVGGPAQGGTTAPREAPAAPAASLSLQERKLEAAGNATKRVEEFNQYRQENEGASVQKVALRQLMQDAERVRTGAGADKEQAARKWLMAAGQLIPGLQGVAEKYSDPVAAFESINKNAGLIARTAIKQVGGTAASELDAISKSLVGTETSQKGIMVNASQLVGLETYKQARFNAAQQYQDANGTLKGFAADFNTKAGPAAWVFMSLPAEERAKVGESLRKNSEGKRTLNSIARQLKYIHDNKLDEGVD